MPFNKVTPVSRLREMFGSLPGQGRPLKDYLSYSELIAPSRFPAAYRQKISLKFKLVCSLFILAITLLVLDQYLSDTELITPINLWTLRSLTGFGFLLGCLLGPAVFRHRSNSGRFFHRELRLPGSKFFTIIITGALIAGAWNFVAWRIANHWEFAFSNQIFAEAYYPISSVKSGRSRRIGSRPYIRIDPYQTGQSARLPITDRQYSQLEGNVKGLCASVLQRKSTNGAIQIKSYGRRTWSDFEPPTVKACKQTSES